MNANLRKKFITYHLEILLYEYFHVSREYLRLNPYLMNDSVCLSVCLYVCRYVIYTPLFSDAQGGLQDKKNSSMYKKFKTV